MGTLVFWLGVGLLLALVLLAARVIDRRDRRRGHYLRSSGEMSRDAWEHRRDAVAGDSIGHLNADRSWTAHSRQVEGRSTPPDERREG
jgi:hypothetical protein